MFHHTAPLVALAWYNGLEATGHDPVDMVWYGNMRDPRHIADQMQGCIDSCYKQRLTEDTDQHGYPTFDRLGEPLAPHHAQELLVELESIVMAGSEIHGPDLYPIWDYLGRWTPEDKDKMEKIWVFIEDNETKYELTHSHPSATVE